MSTQAWLPHSMWNLSGPGIEPMSPALEGKVLTTGLPQKSLEIFSRTLSNPFLVDLLLFQSFSEEFIPVVVV